MTRRYFSISHSALRRWQTCPHKWYLHSVVGLRHRLGDSSPEQNRGKLFHAMVELTWREHASGCNASITWDGERGEMLLREVARKLYVDEGCSVDEPVMAELLAAIRYHARRWRWSEWEVVRMTDGSPIIELDVNAGLAPGVDMHAIIDLVVRHIPTGLVYVIDWKTTAKQISSGAPAYLPNDVQLIMQREILERAGIHVDHAMLWRLRSRAPERPGLTQRGKVTRDKTKLACDWATYEAALRDNGEEVTDDHIAVQSHLNDTCFARTQIDMASAATRKRIVDEEFASLRLAAEAMARYIEDAKLDEPTAPTYAKRRLPMLLDESHARGGCNRCIYRAWCRAELRDGKPDTRLLLTTYTFADAGEAWHRPELDPPADLTMPQTPDDQYLEFARAHGVAVSSPSQEFIPT